MLETTEASYVPGGWVAVAATYGWLLVDLPPQDPILRRCWKLLSEEAATDAVLDALSAGGIGAAPAFALVTAGPGDLRAVARHSARVDFHLVGGDLLTVASEAGVSWSDRTVADRVDAVALAAPNPSGHTVELPMGTGVTAASSVTVSMTRVSSAPGRPAPDATSLPAAPARTQIEDQLSESGSERVEPELPRTSPDDLRGPSTEAGDEKRDPAEADDQTPLPSYDHLFEATQHPPAPVKALRPKPVASPGTDQPAASGKHLPPARSTEHTANWGTGPVPQPAPSDGGLIQGVPWMTSDSSWEGSAAPGLTTSETALSTSGVPEPGEQEADESSTIDRSRIRVETGTGPTVLAGRCPNGHLSAPYADLCRVCRVPMPAPQPFETSRPVLGVLRISTGDEITLDRGVLLGRSPEAKIDSDEERPHVVRLRSPEKDISRNHAEIVLEGWNVYVRDLKSVNGTEVTLPDQPPVRLRENDLQLLEHGATISLAEEVVLTFEVTP